MVIRQINSGKAAAHDNIPAGALNTEYNGQLGINKTIWTSQMTCPSIGSNIHKAKSKIFKYNTEHRPNYTGWRNSDRCGIPHVPGKHNRLTWRIRCRRKGEDWKSKVSISIIEEHKELKTTVSQYQSGNLQYERQDSFTVRS
ncbi:unnamed protein product [Schistosoma margrebowiei]|uniref:Uncharacterized protein n=1 Tax=Schistosoma margrebowiei TaxID=48269 RepID=A0A183MKE0_9TREM|nr:unnamed protein product [Schistosoma margrebowiei]